MIKVTVYQLHKLVVVKNFTLRIYVSKDFLNLGDFRTNLLIIGFPN